ncbi:hypothetical protein FRB99_004798, partial [Tulasnella sp. 403]
MLPTLLVAAVLAVQTAATAIHGPGLLKRQAPQVQALPGCEKDCGDYSQGVTTCAGVATCLCDSKVQRNLFQCLECNVQVQGPTNQPANAQAAQSVANAFASNCQTALTTTIAPNSITTFTDFSKVTIVTVSSPPPATTTPASVPQAQPPTSAAAASTATASRSAAPASLRLASGSLWNFTAALGAISLLVA